MRAARGARGFATASAILALLGCATPIGRQQLPFESPVIEVAPGAPYERCVRLTAGDRLYFAYRADPPMSFALRRGEDASAIVAYVVREAAREETGLFVVPEGGDYCLHWKPVDANAPWPTLLRFEIRLTGNPDQ
jgi:hypothetical protein